MSKPINSSQHLRVLLVLGLIGANLILLAVAAYTLYQSRQLHELRAGTATQNIASAVHQSVTNSVERIDLALHSVVDELERELAGKGIDEHAANTYLERLQRRLPELEAFRVADANGLVFLGKGVIKDDRVSWADRDYFIYHQEHADGGLHFRKPRMGRVAKQYIINLSRRFNYPDGRFAGVVSAPIAVDHFYRLLTKYDIGPKGTLILRDSDLGLITRVPAIPEQAAGQIGNDGVSREFRQLAESGTPSATYHILNSPDGLERILSYQRLEKPPIYAIVGTAIEDYLGDWKIELYKTGAMMAGFMLLSAILGTFLFRLLARSEQDQARLRKSEGQLRTIIATEPQCIKVLDAAGNLLEMNAAGLAMIEADSLDQVIGRPLLDIVTPEYRDAVVQMLQRVLSGESVQQEFEIQGLKGGRRLLETYAVPMQYDDRTTLLAVTRDITEQKKLGHALRDRMTELSIILDSSSVGIALIRERTLIWVNRRMSEMFGWSLDEMRGMPTQTLYESVEPHAAIGQRAYPVLAKGERFVSEQKMRRRDGQLVWMRLSGQAIAASDVAQGSIWVFEDITEQMRAQSELRQAKDAAEAANIAKSQFLATMSHEIRTPMNGILGMAEMLLLPGLKEEDRVDYARTVLNSGRTLLRLLNDILDLSKVEAGKLELSCAAFSPCQIIEETTALFSEHAYSKGLRIEAICHCLASQRYSGDAIRLRQMVSNLIGNAIKFTAHGFVRLEVAEIERDGQQARLEFSVTDSGIGIPPDRLPLLFKPFSQADSSPTREYGGSGLGLSIIRSLAKMMGGEVGVDSEVGKGSRFWFAIQVDILEKHEDSREFDRDGWDADAAVEMPGMSGTVLVVEDNPINRKVAAALLGKLGLRVLSLENGQEAIVAITGGLQPDLILMDVQMPVMDGLKATETIRQWEKANHCPGLKIIALTAGAFAEDRQQCLAAGMNDFLAKPINLKELGFVIRKWLG